ncbi:MAG: ribonuclease P protein component [Bacteroidota bacterium]
MDSPQRFTLSRVERLRKKKAFSYLFSSGKHARAGFIKIIYTTQLPESLQTSPLMAGFSVPKRRFKKASDRNLLKRRLREVHRQNKLLLLSDLKRKEENLVILYIYQGKHIASYHEIESLVIKSMRNLRELTGLSKDG